MTHMSKYGYEWAVTKNDTPPWSRRDGKLSYPEHERASKAYTHYISGFTEDEIANFLGAPVEEIQKDIEHITSLLPLRTIIGHQNDRLRILIQRTEGEQYRKLLSQALRVPADDYLRAGIAPAGPLKEYREAVGMTDRPGAFNINVSQNQVTVSNENGISSSEDILRKVMDKINAKQQQETVIDVQAEEPAAEPEAADEPTEDSVPDVE
jgi:hypothetical protein